MPLYRCYFLSFDRHFRGVATVDCVDCVDDASACQAALHLMQAGRHSAVELWDGSRQVGCVERPEDA
jgi:hypothetical protein